MIRVLMIGDVVGQGMRCPPSFPAFKRAQKIDLVVANGENSAEGNGILPHSAEHLLTAGGRDHHRQPRPAPPGDLRVF